VSSLRKANRRTQVGSAGLSQRWRVRHFHPDHEYFISEPRANKNRERHSAGTTLISGVVIPGPNDDAKAIEDRVQSFSQDQLLARYHELVNLILEKNLEYTERFELERIEARLDYQDKDELERTAAMREAWEQERGELVDSLERLLAGFRAAR